MFGFPISLVVHTASPLKVIVVLALTVVPLLAQQCDSGVTFSGPIQIGKGGTYTGNWQSTDPSVPAVNIYTMEPVTIVNSRLRGPGDLIASGIGSKLTVEQSCFVGTNPNVAGRAKGTPIHTYQAASVLVENCDFESGGYYGVWVQQYLGDHTLNNTIKILNNRIYNVDGRFSDGNGGYLANQYGFSHGIILSDVYGVPGVEIAWNQIINEPYQSGGETDLINVYESSGTLASPMQIHDNYLQGGYAANPANANALGYSGSGFTTDGSAQTDPSQSTSFLKIHDNQAVSMGNAGISIAIGHDLEMYANRVVSSGQLSDGTNITTTYAAGMAHWDWRYPPPAAPPGNFGNNSVHDNLSGLRRLGIGGWERFDYYIPVPPVVSFNNAQWAPTTAAGPTLTDEADELLLWHEKLMAHGATVGSSMVVPSVNGRVDIVSGNNQVGSPNAALSAPIVARVMNQAGAPVAGVSVSFMVTTGNATTSQHFAVTDASGLTQSGIVLGTAPAGVQVSTIAAGYAGASFSLWIMQPAASITSGGIAGVGGSVPAVKTLSQNALISIYGQGFLPIGATGRRVLPSEYVNGGLPTMLQGVCVDVGGQRAAMLDVYPRQINVQVPAVTGTSGSIRVLTNCGTPAETTSPPQTVAVSAASPEFLYFQTNADGKNPVVLVNAVTGALVGPSTILNSELTPARTGDVVTAYGTGFGLLTPAVATGQIPRGTAYAVGPVSVSIGGVALAVTDVLYAGAAPGQIIDQLNFRVPAGVSTGNQTIVISIAGVSSPPNAFVAIQQ